jgi:CDP-glucose 4,6-dehydratase
VFSHLSGKNILVTGHTGFTGGWACLALHRFGVRVHGVALPPSTTPSLFVLADVSSTLESHALIDIGDEKQLIDHIYKIEPDAILHLAAQPLVLPSYSDPVETFRTNVLGTVHVLEAARRTPSVRGLVAITTDKVYANPETGTIFTEGDRIGGYDPYSASKAASEMAIDGYRRSLASWRRTLRIETARGGNIIGGGDFSPHRLVPDFVRSVLSDNPLPLRHPSAIRPWQHVLCLVHGYLMLLDKTLSGSRENYGEAWNFGPLPSDSISVEALLQRLGRHWRHASFHSQPTEVHESATLLIDSAKARSELGWQPALDLDGAIALTADWYKIWSENPANMAETTRQQISGYFANAAAMDADR